MSPLKSQSLPNDTSPKRPASSQDTPEKLGLSPKAHRQDPLFHDRQGRALQFPKCYCLSDNKQSILLHREDHTPSLRSQGHTHDPSLSSQHWAWYTRAGATGHWKACTLSKKSQRRCAARDLELECCCLEDLGLNAFSC